MDTIPPNIAQDEERLGILTMEFHGTRDQNKRKTIAEKYSETVDRLINSGHWHEAPAAEDHLPDDWMPAAFVKYWWSE